jgi:membrane carboxypeptidase/penicillin-binding protein PbpC
VLFINPLRDTDFEENETAKLECDVNKITWNSTGAPIEISWYKSKTVDEDLTKAENIKDGGRFHISKINRKLILKVDNLTVADDGFYTIKVDTVKSTCKLSISEIPISFKRHLSDVKQKEGQSCTFECTINRPDKEAKWYINDHLITDQDIKSGNFTIKKDKNKHELVINNLKLSDDRSTIRCEFGRVKSEANLEVQEEDIKFLDRLVDIGVKENDDVQFMCRISKLKLKENLAPINFKWFLKNKEINKEFLENNNARFTIEQHDTTFKLIIKTVKPEDHGDVKFQVRNDLYSIASLVVEEEPIVFVKKLEDQTCTEIPSVVKFECELNKSNVNVNWFKNGKSISTNNSDKYEFVQEGTKYYLIIKKVDGTDASDYTIAIPGKVEKKCHATLFVKSAPKILKETIKTANITIKRGQSLLLDAKYSANPEPKITWFFNDEVIPDSSRIKRETVRNNLTTFLMEKTQRSDSGSYMLSVENEFGKDSYVFKVTVLDKPGPPRDLKVFDITCKN